MPTITELVAAPLHSRFASDAFDGVIGVTVPLSAYPGCSATLISATVTADGASVLLQFDFDETSWEEMSSQSIHSVLRDLGARDKKTPELPGDPDKENRS